MPATEVVYSVQIDPIKLCRQQQGLSGEVELIALERLYGAINDINLATHAVSVNQQDTTAPTNKIDNSAVMVNYTVSSVLDEDNRYSLKGKAQVTLKLLCNRCMQPLEQEINAEFCLYPINSEAEITAVWQQVDVVFMQHGLVDLHSLLEDELILGLPQFPKHAIEDQSCLGFKTKSAPIDDKAENDAKIVRVNPFSQLVNLINR